MDSAIENTYNNTITAPIFKIEPTLDSISIIDSTVPTIEPIVSTIEPIVPTIEPIVPTIEPIVPTIEPIVPLSIVDLSTWHFIYITSKQKSRMPQEEFEKYGIKYNLESGLIKLLIPPTFTINKKYSGDNTLTTIANQDVRIELNEKNTSYDSYCYSSFYTGDYLQSMVSEENQCKNKRKELSKQFSDLVTKNFSSSWSSDNCYVVYFFQSGRYEADRYYSGCKKPAYYYVEWDRYRFIGYTSKPSNMEPSNMELYKELQRLYCEFLSTSNEGYQQSYDEIIIRCLPDGHKNLHKKEYTKFNGDKTEVNASEIGTKINLESTTHVKIPFYDR